ncbi:MAG: cytidylate kinase family protein, partial [Syntrophobacteraceae bacterium]
NVSDLSDDVHMEIDRRQRELAINESNLILEGRLAGWLTSDLRHVFRVLCYCPLHVRITRYMQREHCDESTAIHQIEERDIGDRLKYRKIYGVYDYRDSSFYTMLVDTSVSHPDDLAFEILSNSGLINIT